MLLSLIFERITIIPKGKYEKKIKQAKSKISDPKDIPYLACCIATHSAGIWTHDQHLKEQKEVKVFTNIDMLNLINSPNPSLQ